MAPIPEAVDRLLLDGLLCNAATVFLADGAWKLSGDPTEGALVTSALKLRADAELLRKTNARPPRG